VDRQQREQRRCGPIRRDQSYRAADFAGLALGIDFSGEQPSVSEFRDECVHVTGGGLGVYIVGLQDRLDEVTPVAIRVK